MSDHPPLNRTSTGTRTIVDARPGPLYFAHDHGGAKGVYRPPLQGPADWRRLAMLGVILVAFAVLGLEKQVFRDTISDHRTLATYLLQIALLGGYLARNHNPPPGNIVVWRGLTRLNDIAFGISIVTRGRCG